MKRKLTILGVCALVALGTILAFSNRQGRGRTAGTTHSLVVTQDGKLGVQMQPNERGKVTLLWNLPKTNSNTLPPVSNPGNK